MNTVDILMIIFSFGIIPLTIGVWYIAWYLEQILKKLQSFQLNKSEKECAS